MNSQRPDFFIVGAPKCGTTSIAAWLYGHPQVFMSRAKEPSFFDTDSPRVGVRTLAHYRRCFRGVGAEHLAVGEASPNYLFSQVAVQAILEFNPQAKFIVALRDPVQMAPSLHAQLFYNHHEDVADFALAWQLQELRVLGHHIPPRTRLPHFLQYRSACSLGSQLAALYAAAGRHKVCVVLLDDLQRQPRVEYQRVLAFLGVPDDHREAFPIMNSSAARAPGPLRLLRRNLSYLKQALGIAHWSRSRWSRGGTRQLPREAPYARSADSMRALLEKEFQSEVDLMQRLLGRDLQALWRPRVAAAASQATERARHG